MQRVSSSTAIDMRAIDDVPSPSAPLPACALSTDARSPVPDSRPVETVIELGDQVKEELRAYLQAVARNITDENAEALLGTLERHGVVTKDQLKTLIGTASVRDHARSIAAGMVVFAGSFGPASVVAAGMTMVHPGAAPLVGNAVAAFLNPIAQGAAREGGLGAKYNPLSPPPAVSRLSLSGKSGTAITNDMPVKNFGMAYMMSNTVIHALDIKGMPTAGVRAAFGVAAAGWTARDVRASLEAKATFSDQRIEGQLKDQAWLDAKDLHATDGRLSTLQQSSLRATLGYALDVAKACRYLPQEMARTATSPRSLANFLALGPHALVAGLKAVVPSNEVKLVMQQCADFLLVGGWQFRQQVENRMTRGFCSHPAADRRGAEACEAVWRAIGSCCERDVERGVDVVPPANAPQGGGRVIAAYEQTVHLEDETARRTGPAVTTGASSAGTSASRA